MKTKIFFILCLISGFTTSRLSAQNNNPDGTKSIVYTFEWPNFVQGVVCDGERDILMGSVTYKETDLFKDGILIRGNAINYGEAVSTKDGEVFRIKEIYQDWGDVDADGVFLNMTWHFSLKGDQGTHYIGSFTYMYGTIFMNKMFCPGNKKK